MVVDTNYYTIERVRIEGKDNTFFEKAHIEVHTLQFDAAIKYLLKHRKKLADNECYKIYADKHGNAVGIISRKTFAIKDEQND